MGGRENKDETEMPAGNKFEGRKQYLQVLLLEVYLHYAHLVIELKRHYGYPSLQMETFITGKVLDILFLLIFFFFFFFAYPLAFTFYRYRSML